MAGTHTENSLNCKIACLNLKITWGLDESGALHSFCPGDPDYVTLSSRNRAHLLACKGKGIGERKEVPCNEALVFLPRDPIASIARYCHGMTSRYHEYVR